MKNVIRNHLPRLCCLLLVGSCTWACNPPSEIGASFIPEESFVLNAEDITEIKVLNRQLEEVLSPVDGRILTGFHEDEQFGELRSTAYLQLSIDDFGLLDETIDYRYDSLTLALVYDGYYAYDTTQAVGLSVHRIIEPFESGEDDELFYADSELTYERIPLGKKEFRPRPGKPNEEVEIRLSDNVGFDLFRQLEAGSDEVLINEEWFEYFRGVAIVADSTLAGGAFLGFSSATQLRLHFTDRGETPAREFVRTFTVGSSQRFNQITADRGATLLAELNEDNDIDTRSVDHLLFLQSGKGLVARLTFDNILSLRDLLGESIINSAALRLSIPFLTEEEQRELPPSINLFWVDEDDRLVFQNESANLILDTEFGRDTYYSADITDFVSWQADPESDADNALLLSLGNGATSMESLVLGGPLHPSHPLRLSVSYTRLKE